MATNYPGAIDSLTNPSAGDALTSPSHSAQHANANDAIEAIETELGTDPSGSSATVKARFEVIEANDWVTSARIADGTIVAADVAASTFAAHATVGNLLTANQATGGDASGDTTGLYGDGTVTTRQTDYAAQGTGSIRAVASGDGAFTAGQNYGTHATRITPGETYTYTLSVRPIGDQALSIYVSYRDAAGTVWVSQHAGPVVTCIDSTWTELRATHVAPAGAYTAHVVVYCAAGVTSQQLNIDNLGIWRGAAGVWQAPGVPVPGQSRIAVNNAVDLSGTGTPEGVVTAAPGSTWLQTDSTTDVKGWIKWVKASGTGNTGWQVDAEYDSGSRDLAAVSMSNSWAVSGSLFKLQRVGRTVSIDAAFTKASASADAAYTLPAGFRPQQATVRRIANTDTADDFVTVSITSAGVISIVRSSMASDIVYLSLSFLCATAAPSSLPGS